MVERQVRPWDVLDVRVLDVLVRLPREAFVPETHRARAYADIELPLGHGERMMKPVVEGRALQALELQPGDEVLEIGTGSGFLAACLGRLARDVVSIERHARSEEHTSELQSLMRISYAVFCLKKKINLFSFFSSLLFIISFFS